LNRYIIYEVWTRSSEVKAKSLSRALLDNTPPGQIKDKGLTLCNWHAVEIKSKKGKGGKGC